VHFQPDGHHPTGASPIRDRIDDALAFRRHDIIAR
jgi:hypothetical protein